MGGRAADSERSSDRFPPSSSSPATMPGDGSVSLRSPSQAPLHSLSVFSSSPLLCLRHRRSQTARERRRQRAEGGGAPGAGRCQPRAAAAAAVAARSHWPRAAEGGGSAGRGGAGPAPLFVVARNNAGPQPAPQQPGLPRQRADRGRFIPSSPFFFFWSFRPPFYSTEGGVSTHSALSPR